MGYIENIQAQAKQAAEAKAFRDMQANAEQKNVASQGFVAGHQQGMQEAVSRLLAQTPQEQRESNLYSQQEADTAANRELQDNRSYFDKAADSLAGYFAREQKSPIELKAEEVQQAQAAAGQPVMGKDYLMNWLSSQENR